MNEDHQVTTRCTDLATSAWTEIAACLEHRKKLVYEEIRNYPTPITACDQQFNYLLEKQAKIANELWRLKALRDAAMQNDRIDLIDEISKLSVCIGEEAVQRILLGLREAVRNTAV